MGSNNVLLEERIKALIESTVPSTRFVVLGKNLIEEASPEEKLRCKKQISILEKLIEDRQRRLQQHFY
jgi:hypothetical protein